MPVSVRSLALLAVVFVPLVGCPAPAEVDGPPGSVEPLPADTPAVRSPELDDAKARWEAAGLDAYRMTLQRSCFCPEDYRGPFDVTVRDGAVATVRFNGASLDADRAVTVDDLFALIEDAYKRNAASVDVAFDPDLGYPTSVGIDYSTQMADEEMAYTVADLVPAER